MEKKTIYARFREMVMKYPNEPAVIEDGLQLSYSELDGLADRIMAKFYNQNPAKVGIIMSHGAKQVAAMLAVLKSGAGYVPAEPALPKDRIDYMMKTAGVSVVITDDYCDDLPEADGQMKDRSTPEGVAYVLFTSGTSGKPKGVVIENHSVVNYARAFQEEFKIGPGAIMLQYSVCSFDIFVEEVFATILNGGTVAVPPKDVYRDIDELMKFVTRHEVTIIDGFPYLLAEMNKLDDIPSSVNLIISGGDVIRAGYISNLRNRGVRIYNTYGPSETTVCSNYFRIDDAAALDDGTFPIGKPVKGVDVKIMSPDLHELPTGEIGEICISGEGVGRGYIGNPPEQKNFIVMADDRKMYRSGDLGYVLPDGNMVFLHRKDDQVMILGRRVEPEEVENVLNTCPYVESGVVRSFLDDKGLPYLTAYIVPNGACRVNDVKNWLASKLADFMIPEYFIKMKRIPLTPRGKVDVDALPVVMKEGEI